MTVAAIMNGTKRTNHAETFVERVGPPYARAPVLELTVLTLLH